MKNKIVHLIAFAVMFSVLATGCKKESDPNYGELLLGTWINTHVNNLPVLTDESFTVSFLADQTEVYSIGVQLDDNNSTWIENDSYTYVVNGDLIIIDGSDSFGSVYHMEFKILALDEEWLNYSIEEFTVDGESFPNTKTYACYKITTDFSSEFTGTWYGECTSADCADTTSHYWEYFADGSYSYYFQDEAGNWIKKLDNEGRYFLYGHLFVSNHASDQVAGGMGKAYECWDFEIVGANMVWTGWRENEEIVTYEMNRVSGPPVTN
jgi:hypothetical protein